MQVKKAIIKAYNDSSETWHKVRTTTADNYTDIKVFKFHRPHLFIEKPAITAKVPDLTGKNILCLGCGSGEECDFLLTKNPASLTGIDISNKLIAIASKTHPKLKFITMDAEKLKFKDESFDFIYSSLLLDYFKDWRQILSEIYRVLKPGGIFLFSNIHPVKWAAEYTRGKDGKKREILMGFSNDLQTGKQHIYGDYLNSSLHQEIWMEAIPICYYTKSISEMFNEIKASGLEVLSITEPKAILETKKYFKDYWELNQKMPSFIVFETKKN